MRKFLFLAILFNMVFFTTTWAKYCSNCGVVLDDKAKFCSECGNSQNNTVNKVVVQEETYTGESALKYLKEQSIYLPSLPLLSFNTEYAKFRVEAEKIIEQSKTDSSGIIKADFVVPTLLIAYLEITAQSVNSILSESDTYTDYNIFTKQLVQVQNDKISKIKAVWRGYNEKYKVVYPLNEIFTPFKKAEFLGKYQKVKELKEKEKNEKGRLRTKRRHAQFTFSKDISKFNAIYVRVDSYEDIIFKKDFKDNSIILKNISDHNIYGCGTDQSAIGLIE